MNRKYIIKYRNIGIYSYYIGYKKSLFSEEPLPNTLSDTPGECEEKIKIFDSYAKSRKVKELIIK